MRKKFLALILMLSLALLLCGFDREQQKVYDDAGLFTQQEWERLQQECVSTALAEELDVIILTRDRVDTRSAEQIADDFYDQYGFGYEAAHGTGIILVIDMYSRVYSITTSGYAIEWYTDREIETFYDEMESQMRYGDYYGACLTYLDEVVRLKNNGEVAQNGYYDPATQTFVSTEKGPVAQAFTPFQVILRLVLSAVVGFAGAMILKRSTKPRMSVGRATYLKDNRLFLRRNTDRYTHETVIHRRIPKPPKSSGGGGGGFSSSRMSGGGFSHGGGGGRKF